MMLLIIALILFPMISLQAADDGCSSSQSLGERRSQAHQIIMNSIKKPWLSKDETQTWQDLLKQQEKEQEQGVQLYRQLIEENEDYAAVHLANHFLGGDIYPTWQEDDRIRSALEVLMLGVRKNNPNAIFRLAQLDKEHDYKLVPGEELIEYLKSGERQNHDSCRCFLASLYRDKILCGRWGISYNPQQAIDLYLRSYQAKSDVGACTLADMYLSGELDTKDFVRAYKLLKPCLDKQDNRSHVMWENFKKRTIYPNILVLLEKQFDRDDDNANYYIAKGYLKGRYGLKIDFTQVEYYLLQGITKQNPIKSLYLLAKFYGGAFDPPKSEFTELNQDNSKKLEDERKVRQEKMREMVHLLSQYRTLIPGRYWSKVSDLRDSSDGRFRCFLANHYYLKLKSQSKASLCLENLRMARDPRNVCANYFCARLWCGLVETTDGKVIQPSVLSANLHFKNAIVRLYPPALCLRAEMHLLGYLGQPNPKRAKAYLEKAANDLKSYKAKVMLSNYERVINSRMYTNFIENKDPDMIPTWRKTLREMLFRYN